MGASCTDVDECTTDADDCISNVVCTNTVGGFTCSCPAGYYGDATATAGATVCTSLNCQESGASERQIEVSLLVSQIVCEFSKLYENQIVLEKKKASQDFKKYTDKYEKQK